MTQCPDAVVVSCSTSHPDVYQCPFDTCPPNRMDDSDIECPVVT